MPALPTDLTVQYQNLLQACLLGAAPSGRGLSFVSKSVGGAKHWYLQLTIGSRKTQHYLGPDDDATRAQMAAQEARWHDAAPDLAERERLVAGLVAGGAPTISATEARVFEVLEQAGVFAVGGVLIGSHAFRAFSMLLGVRWPEGTDRTLDVDLADTVEVGAVPDDVPLATRLLESGLGFVEVPALDRKSPTTKFKIRNSTFIVELLTPLVGRPKPGPVYLPNLKAYASPLRWLDYLIEDRQPAVLLAKAGILVNVPTPARYALHKLAISRRREPHAAAKAEKDIAQAAAILETLRDLRPGDVWLALDAARAMPEKFYAQLCEGAQRLPKTLRDWLAPRLA